MTSDPILEQLNGVFRDVFRDPTLSVQRATMAADVPGWDSLRHIDLVVAVEDEFGVRFKSSELGKLDNVGALVDLLRGRVE